MGLRQDFMHASDPVFDIDDVYMEPTDLDMATNQDIVPRVGLNNLDDRLTMQSSKYGGKMPRLR